MLYINQLDGCRYTFSDEYWGGCYTFSDECWGGSYTFWNEY